MRGRKPLPTSVHEWRGNPGNRPLNTNEPELPPLEPDPNDAAPIELAGDARAVAEWDRLFTMLTRARQITQAERGSLIALCQQWSRYIDSNSQVKRDGLVIKSASGYPMPNPYIGIANRALANCTKLWAELGLTPSSRSRVQTAGAAATTPSAGERQRQRYFGTK